MSKVILRTKRDILKVVGTPFFFLKKDGETLVEGKFESCIVAVRGRVDKDNVYHYETTRIHKSVVRTAEGETFEFNGYLCDFLSHGFKNGIYDRTCNYHPTFFICDGEFTRFDFLGSILERYDILTLPLWGYDELVGIFKINSFWTYIDIKTGDAWVEVGDETSNGDLRFSREEFFTIKTFD